VMIANAKIAELINESEEQQIFTENKLLEKEMITRSLTDSTWISNMVKEVIYLEDSTQGLELNLSKIRNNIVVALSDDIVFTKDLMSQLNKLNLDHEITLFGLPDWNNFRDMETNQLLNLNLHTFTASLVDYSNPNIINWIKSYRSQYLTEPTTTNYAFDGFDAGWYFLNALYLYGTGFTACIQNFNPGLIQTQLHFESKANNGFQNIYWNMGKYAFIEGDGGFAISYTPWLRNLIPDINLAYLSGYYRVDDQSVVSASLRYFSLGNIVFTDITGTVTGQYNPNEFAVDAGYSRLLTDNFSMGLAFRFVRSDLTSGQVTSDGQATNPGISFGADLGLYYENDIDVGGNDAQWAVGAAFTNMGTPVSYTEDSEKTPVPTNMRIGGRFTYYIDDYNSISGHLDVNKLLVPTPPVVEEDTATGELEVIRGKEAPNSVVAGMFQSFYDAPGVLLDDGTYSTFREEINEIAYSLGVEYWYREQFAIRAGYFHEHATKGNRKYFTVGVGLQLNVFALDFSYLVPTNGQNSPLANTLRFTLGFNL